jgi:hypothetical protein
MTNETLEEAAANLADPNLCKTDNWIAGAKWQAERMYSAEDMIEFSEWVALRYPNQRKFLTLSDKKGFYTTKELLDKWQTGKN